MSQVVASADNQAATSINFQISTSEEKINVSGKIAPVPEPATMMLLGIGLVGSAVVGRKKIISKS